MKNTTSLLALMAALSLGSALAAGTPAGTVISNTATATFSDAGGTSVPEGATSNPVTTTVTAVPSFTITPNSTDQDNTASGYTRTDVLPGSAQSFAYTITNTGNTPVVVDLTTSYRTGGNAGTQPTQVQYVKDGGNGTLDWTDANGDGVIQQSELGSGDTLLSDSGNGNGAVDTGTLGVNGSVVVFQKYIAPNAANVVSGADPVGTATYNPTLNAATTPNPAASSLTTTVPNPATGTGTLTDSDNFNKITTITPAIKVGPTNDPGGTSTTVSVTDPNSSTNRDTVPQTNYGPGTAANPNGTPQADNLFARPPADGDSNPDTVTFVNTVSNGTGTPDTVSLIPPTGLPTGVTVTFQAADGTALPVVGGRPQLLVPANGSASFRVVVVYPDSDSAISSTPIVISVGVDSGNDGADTAADDTTTDTILPPNLQFGDATQALGTSSNPNPSETVVPGVTPGTTANSTDSRATFGMDVYNSGQQTEAFTLQGAVVVPLTDGTSTTVQAVYYTYTDTNGNGVFDAGDIIGTQLTAGTGSNTYVTPALYPGEEYKVVAVLDLPANAASTLTSAPLTVSQSATGNTSGVSRTDTNDEIVVNSVGSVGVVKSAFNCGDTAPNIATANCTASGASAKPGDYLMYTIVATNSRNNVVKSFILSDAVPTNTTYYGVRASSTQTGTVLYRAAGSATWSAAAPTAATTTGIDVGVDTNSDTTIAVADTLGAGKSITVTFFVKVN